MHWGVARTRAALALARGGGRRSLARLRRLPGRSAHAGGAAGAAAAVPRHGGARRRRADGGDRRLRRRGRPAGAGTGRAGADRQPARRGRRPAPCRPTPGSCRGSRSAAGRRCRSGGRTRSAALPAGDERAAARRRGSARRGCGSSARPRGERLACLAGAAMARASRSLRRNRRAGAAACTCDDDAPGGVIRRGRAARPALARRARPLGPARRPGRGGCTSARCWPCGRLTDRRTGAVAAGARDGWAYVWPRDAAAAALALAAAGYRGEARRVARFLLGLDLAAAARFDGDGAPVAGPRRPGRRLRLGRRRGPRRRPPARPAALDLARPRRLPGESPRRLPRQRARRRFADRDGETPIRPDLGRGGWCGGSGDPGSGLDSAAAWAVRPFSAARPLSRRSAAHPLRLLAEAGALRHRPRAKPGRTPIPGRRRPPGAPGASPRSASAARRCACSATCAAPRPPPASCPSASTPAPASPARPRRSPGRTPSRSSPCASSGPGARICSGAMEVRPATIADCEALARGMRSVVEEGAGSPPSHRSPVEDLEQRFRASVEWDGWFLFVLEAAGRSSARSGCSRPRPTGCSRWGCGSCRSGADKAADGR